MSKFKLSKKEKDLTLKDFKSIRVIKAEETETEILITFSKVTEGKKITIDILGNGK